MRVCLLLSVVQDIHPFYADLINVLYSRDHYKLALGQLSTARSLVDNVSKDYLKLLKFGDSLYRCKELKRAALGRMCTVMKKLGPSLSYLEQVRQHLSRLPSIDPSTRTLMITGYPNVGKSSFINKVSNANVEVQPYAFTTKSLFIGHTDYKYMRWQVLDTPGILDHPLEDRNTIEMQAITALAHLHSTVLYFLDISEQCGYTLEKQVSLFHNIKPLFQNKPLLIVANKTDLRKMEDLTAEERALIDTMLANRPDTHIMPMSNMTDDGITNVLHTGCDLLLAHRIEKKLSSTSKMTELSNRLMITTPVARDNKERPVYIPESVRLAREAAAKRAPGVDAPRRKTERDLELEAGGPGIYNIDLKKNYMLANPEWNHDIIPEFMDGKNIADFIDPDIERRLAELEAEEAVLEAEYEAKGAMAADGESDLEEDQKEAVAAIRVNRRKVILHNRLKSTNNKSTLPRQQQRKTIGAVADNLEARGIDADAFVERARSRSKVRAERGLKRNRSPSGGDDNDDADMEDVGGADTTRSYSREASLARVRSRSRDHKRVARVEPSPFRNIEQKLEAEKKNKKSQKGFQGRASRGESDRKVLDMKPKHLFSGSTSIGKRDRR